MEPFPAPLLFPFTNGSLAASTCFLAFRGASHVNGAKINRWSKSES
jgi:hypothetical protein